MAPFRPCGPPSPGMPPASRASRPCAGYDACKNLQLSFVLARQLKDLFRPYGAPSPCAGYDACENLQASIVLARPSTDLFHRFAVPLPRARGRLRDLLRSCSAEGQEPERRDVFRLETHSDCPQGWDPIRKALRAGCRNAAAGGETSSLLAACWGTFSCALKPEYIPQRLRFALVCQLPGERASFKQSAFRAFVRLR